MGHGLWLGISIGLGPAGLINTTYSRAPGSTYKDKKYKYLTYQKRPHYPPIAAARWEIVTLFVYMYDWRSGPGPHRTTRKLSERESLTLDLGSLSRCTIRL